MHPFLYVLERVFGMPGSPDRELALGTSAHEYVSVTALSASILGELQCVVQLKACFESASYPLEAVCEGWCSR